MTTAQLNTMDRVKSVDELRGRINDGAFENKLPFERIYPSMTQEVKDTVTEINKKYHAEQQRLWKLFRCEAISACGLKGHKKGEKAMDKAWDIAWDTEHSNGYIEVLAELEELADLML